MDFTNFVSATQPIGSRIGYQAAQAGLFLEKPGLSLGVFWGGE
jgi:hypothetical protein